tara:strand:- start:9004 stop:10779 length:1776 start_codon:yes stop_codon:yes gene_type:complete
MALFDKVSDITEFNWQRKVGRTDETNQDNLPANTTANKKLEDRLGEVDDQYEKFNGNKGLRTGNLGFDEPFIVKEVGDGYDSAKFDDGIFRGGLALNVVRAAEDVTRLAKWTLTSKGVLFNLKQFALQAQNPIGENRIFNPGGIFGSAIPGIHLPRHTNGTFLDFQDPPKYQTDKDGNNRKMPETDEDAGIFGAIGGALGIGGARKTNRLLQLYDSRMIKGEGSAGRNPVIGALGLGNQEFEDPKRVVDSTLGPYGGPLEEETNQFGFRNDTHDELRDFNGSAITDGRGQSNIPQGSLIDAIKNGYETQANAEVVGFQGQNDDETAQNAEDYNLGKGKVAYRGGLYSVGVSNQLQVPYGGKFDNIGFANTVNNKLPKDFIKFRIRDAVNGKWIVFPAHLGTITDTITPEWSTERYIGRPDSVHLYSGASRSVSFDFKVAAFSKQEIPIIQEKMNALVGLAYPTFKKILSGDDEERPVAPYVYLTIGDLFNNTPGYFNSITVTMEENSNWEIDEGLQIPHYFSVSVEFVHVGKYLPNTLGKHYDVPHLKDFGVGNGNNGVFGKNDPRDGTTSRPDMQKATDPKHWSKGVYTD